MIRFALQDHLESTLLSLKGAILQVGNPAMAHYSTARLSLGQQHVHGKDVNILQFVTDGHSGMSSDVHWYDFGDFVPCPLQYRSTQTPPEVPHGTPGGAT